MKFLFLDIDGVLNSRAFLIAADKATSPDAASHITPTQRDLNMIDREAVKRVNRIVDATGAFIVISSTWRQIRTLVSLRKLLVRKGLRNWAVYSETPVLQKERGHEIQSWLNRRKKNVPIDSFVILDDDDDMVHLSSRLVRTDNETGLQDEHVEMAIKMLNEVTERKAA